MMQFQNQLSRWRSSALLLLVALPLLTACKEKSADTPTIEKEAEMSQSTDAADSSKPTKAVATFGGGCFWCVEAVFEEMQGVSSVVSGYAGGEVSNPTYEAVCRGDTGHAEVCQIHFDPSVVTFEELLEVFFKTHDPTTLNRQGADRGTQYRSIIMYESDEQKTVAEQYIAKLNKSGDYAAPIVTIVEPASTFYEAEAYHQDYFANNPSAGYCLAVVGPKVKKFREVFGDKRKTAEEK